MLPAILRSSSFGVCCVVLALTNASVGAQQPTAGGTPAKEFREFSLEGSVRWVPEQPVPRYPEVLVKSGIAGSTLAMFVVDTSGAAEVSSLKIVRTTHPLFAEAIKASLPALHLVPASVGGRHVKQLVQVQYRFTLPGKPAEDTIPMVKNVLGFEVVVVGADGAVASTEPLYIIDGAPSSSVEMRRLAKERIASVDVFKGELALAKYGEAGRHGVVVITTKAAPPTR